MDFVCLGNNSAIAGINLTPFLVETEVIGYPTVLILNRKRELVFRDRLDNAIEYIKELAKR